MDMVPKRDYTFCTLVIDCGAIYGKEKHGYGNCDSNGDSHEKHTMSSG